mmetsp:Transcript_58100/g.101709  ORF Transcript_58100/g.101709 Transcript_58100/m.101709 type:complete len:660 (-) Transcript_58100:62-2041(-)
MMLFIHIVAALLLPCVTEFVTNNRRDAVQPRPAVASMVDNDIGDSEEEQKRRAAAVAASLEAYQKTYDNVEALIDEVHRSDHMVDGFEKPAITATELRQRVKRARKEEQRKELEFQQQQQHAKSLGEVQSKALIRREKAYDGKKPIVSGFWAEDRPDEERIDPDNMRIYKFKGFAKRFPFMHSWNVESMWKKLPLAPQNVHRVRHRLNGEVVTDSFLDESGQPLKYTRDASGFYHIGDQVTAEDMERVARPVDYQNMLQMRQKKKENEGLELYTDRSQEFESLAQKVKSEDKFERADAAWRLELLRHEMRTKLQAIPRRHGKAWISVRGAGGVACSFNAEVGEVTVLQAKKHIEKLTKVPSEIQVLTVGGREMYDGELLNRHLVSGIGNWINLRKKGWTDVRKALIRRGIEEKKSELVKTSSSEGHKAKEADDEERGTMRQPLTEADREKKALQKNTMKDLEAADDAVIRALKSQQAAEQVAEQADEQASFTQASESPIHEKASFKKPQVAVLPGIGMSFLETGLKQVKRHRSGGASDNDNEKSTGTSSRGSGRITRKVTYVRDNSGKWHREEKRKSKHGQRHSDKGSLIETEDMCTEEEGVPIEHRIVSEEFVDDDKERMTHQEAQFGGLNPDEQSSEVLHGAGVPQRKRHKFSRSLQ